jgi:WD40 repeat protein
MRFSRSTCKLASSGYCDQLMCRTHDNAKFASCGGDKVVFIWDVPSGKILRRLSGHFGKINALAFNTDAQILASGMSPLTNAAEY